MQTQNVSTSAAEQPAAGLEQPATPASVRINVQELDHQYGYRFFKRAFDILASGLGLIVLSPLFLVIAILIKLDSRGPVFFHQPRVGKREKQFRMYKFRSMCNDAEKQLTKLLDQNEVEGAMFKIKDDPRVTKVGHFLRKTSLDELPQLWNVFRGDMSLVGPRPPLVREVAEYTDYDKQRLAVTPGCTGLWQVSKRNEVGFHEMVELDLRYIQKRSLFFDIKLVFETVLIMIRPSRY